MVSGCPLPCASTAVAAGKTSAVPRGSLFLPTDCPPTRWPCSPRIAVRRALTPQNGRTHPGFALSSGGLDDELRLVRRPALHRCAAASVFACSCSRALNRDRSCKPLYPCSLTAAVGFSMGIGAASHDSPCAAKEIYILSPPTHRACRPGGRRDDQERAAGAAPPSSLIPPSSIIPHPQPSVNPPPSSLNPPPTDRAG